MTVVAGCGDLINLKNVLTMLMCSGIETATQDLQKENAERVWQEGILRHVPVVGSLVNWWSPPSKEGGIKGRSLNLTAGQHTVLV